MKKVFSILTVILVISAMLNISAVRHYCGGVLAASKISLSGDLASCGMEDAEKSCQPYYAGDLFQSHCCHDFITYYSLDNYINSRPVVTETLRLPTKVLGFHFAIPVQSPKSISRVFTDVSAPTLFLHTAVELNDICVFRI